MTFSRNIAKVKIIVFPKEKQGFSRFRPLKINHFSMLFRSIFHAFSGTPLGATFLRFDDDFLPKSAIWEPPWAPPGLQIRPLGRPFRPKYRLLSYPAGGPERPGTDLAPTWRPKGSQEAPQRPQGSNFVDFGSALAPQWVKTSTERTSQG